MWGQCTGQGHRRIPVSLKRTSTALDFLDRVNCVEGLSYFWVLVFAGGSFAFSVVDLELFDFYRIVWLKEKAGVWGWFSGTKSDWKAQILVPSSWFGAWFVGFHGHEGCGKTGLVYSRGLGDGRVWADWGTESQLVLLSPRLRRMSAKYSRSNFMLYCICCCVAPYSFKNQRWCWNESYLAPSDVNCRPSLYESPT